MTTDVEMNWASAEPFRVGLIRGTAATPAQAEAFARRDARAYIGDFADGRVVFVEPPPRHEFLVVFPDATPDAMRERYGVRLLDPGESRYATR